MNCPKCNSLHVVKCGFKILARGGRKQRWQCQSCGRYFESEIQATPEPVKVESFF